MKTVADGEKKCWTCANWQPRKSGEMAKQKFAVCEVAPKWQFMGPLHSCARHAPLDAAQIAKRRAWLGRVLEVA